MNINFRKTSATFKLGMVLFDIFVSKRFNKPPFWKKKHENTVLGYKKGSKMKIVFEKCPRSSNYVWFYLIFLSQNEI